MKRICIVILIYCSLIMSAGSTMALEMDDVGILDSWMASVDLIDEFGSSSITLETEWVNGIIGTEYPTLWKDEDLTGDWENIITDDGDLTNDSIWAYQFIEPYQPDYFLIKLGINNSTGFSHFLFQNEEKLDWAVVDIGMAGLNLSDITKISHISASTSALAPVPEPATMLLFGAGLIGFAGVHLRKRNK